MFFDVFKWNIVLFTLYTNLYQVPRLMPHYQTER